MPNAYNRIWNFSPGPCTLPVEVLEDVQRELLNHKNDGMSVMEMSHRSKYFKRIFEDTKGVFSEFFAVPESHNALFVGGGAALQFAAVPMNLGKSNSSDTVPVANYVTTGLWSGLARDEAKQFVDVKEIFNDKDNGFTCAPNLSTMHINKEASYVHICDNETVHGVEYETLASVYDLEGQRKILVSDMSSNLGTRPINWNVYDIIYGGAHKNVGIAGVTIVVVNKAVIKPSPYYCPSLMNYHHISKHDSLQNTPPTFPIYVCGLMISHMKKHGDLSYWNEVSTRKSGYVYRHIDESDGFYYAPVHPSSRSRTNVRFGIFYHRKRFYSNNLDCMKERLKAAKDGSCLSSSIALSNGSSNGLENQGHSLRGAAAAESAACAALLAAAAAARVSGEGMGILTSEEQKAADQDTYLEKMFVEMANKREMIHLEGHRKLKGLRASLYNGMTLEGVSTLIEFMQEFQEMHETASDN